MRYAVTIKRTITTEIIMEASSAKDARRKVEEYGISQAAVDFAEQDETAECIKSVAKALEWTT